jgi:glycosyltransferase involved in cell wall biosynthesis
MATPLTFHVPGIWHTRLDPAFSHCAFTTKVRLLPRVLAAAFPEARVVVYIAHTHAEPSANEVIVSLMPDHKQEQLLGHDFSDPTRFVGNDARWDSALYMAANQRLRRALWDTLATEGRHVILHPFGPAHRAATEGLAALQIESGVGYNNPYLPFRIYESWAWLHHIAGLEHRQTTDYEWVVPPTVDPTEWPLGTGPRTQLTFLGRLTDIKGMAVIRDLGRALLEQAITTEIVCYGQGDWAAFAGTMPPNVRYGGVLHGAARADVLARTVALLAPSRFIEPGCQAHAEALMCGVPVLASAHGIFPESIVPGWNGALCRTLGDWLTAAERALATPSRYAPPAVIRAHAIGRFSVASVTPETRSALQQCLDLYADGWATRAPRASWASGSFPDSRPQEIAA